MNGKVYVGRSKDPARRWTQHRYYARAAAPTQKTLIGRALKKYGVEAFEFKVREEYQTTKEACTAERRWIIELGSSSRLGGYNVHAGGNGASYVTAATRQKLASAARQRVVTEAARTSMSYAQRHRDPSVNKKIGDALRGKHRPHLRQLGLDNVGNLLTANQRKKEAASVLRSNIRRLLIGGSPRSAVAKTLGISVGCTYFHVTGAELRALKCAPQLVLS